MKKLSSLRETGGDVTWLRADKYLLRAWFYRSVNDNEKGIKLKCMLQKRRR